MKLEFSSELGDPNQAWICPPTHVAAASAALMLGVCRQRIYQLYNDGKLNGGHWHGLLYLSVESIQMRCIASESRGRPRQAASVQRSLLLMK